MRTRHLELGLITVLAIGLGYSLASSNAAGYPAGPVVSMGSNPIVSSGGSLSIPYGSAASTGLVTAPADQDLIITDLVLDGGTDSLSCIEHWRVDLTIPGETLASSSVSPRYRVRSDYNYSVDNNFEGASHLRLQSGIRIPAGTTAQIEASSYLVSGCGTSRSGELIWTMSGYYAQP